MAEVTGNRKMVLGFTKLWRPSRHIFAALLDCLAPATKGSNTVEWAAAMTMIGLDWIGALAS